MINEYLIADFEHISLRWKIKSDKVSQKWASAVNEAIEKHSSSIKIHADCWNDTETEFNNHYDNLIASMTALKNNIADMPGLPGKKSLNQYALNNIHNWFAKNEKTHELLSSMHHSIHKLESCFSRSIYYPPMIQIGWPNTSRYEFDKDDYFLFSETRKFGGIELTYSHIGKEPFAIFSSKDDLTDEIFVPYTHYSADFYLWFGMNEFTGNNEEFWKWFDKNYEWFKKRTGWLPRDVRARPGRYQVADLILEDHDSKENILSLIRKNPTTIKLRIETK